jgi:hypothetical protein
MQPGLVVAIRDEKVTPRVGDLSTVAGIENGVFRRIWRLEDDRAARLWLDRRVIPPTFTFAPPG